MNNSIITDWDLYCLICGKPTTDHHHLVYSRANRRLSDADGLVIPVCRECHTFIHQNGEAGTMSKIIGQLAWEKNRLAEGKTEQELFKVRQEFRDRFGKSFL